MKGNWGLVDTLLGAALGAWLGTQQQLWSQAPISFLVVALLVVAAWALYLVRSDVSGLVKSLAVGIIVLGGAVICFSLYNFSGMEANRLLPLMSILGGWVLNSFFVYIIAKLESAQDTQALDRHKNTAVRPTHLPDPDGTLVASQEVAK